MKSHHVCVSHYINSQVTFISWKGGLHLNVCRSGPGSSGMIARFCCSCILGCLGFGFGILLVGFVVVACFILGVLFCVCGGLCFCFVLSFCSCSF